MRDQICFVCIGQCAGNVGSLLEEAGFDVLFVNTAPQDLELLKNAKFVYKIADANGCSQDPKRGQSVFAQHYSEVMKNIQSFVRKRIVYFVSSAGGGTSGMTPMVLEAYLEVLEELEESEWQLYEAQNGKFPVKRKAGLITVLPSLGESSALNANAYCYCREIGTIIDYERRKPNSNLANVFVIDNENNSDLIGLNQKFVNLLMRIFEIPNQHRSVMGNVDSADLEKAVTEIGLTVCCQLDELSVSELVNSVRYSDVFTQADDSCAKYWVSSTIADFDVIALEKQIGSPLAHYKTYNSETNLFVFSGLGFPKTRMALLADRAEEFKNSIKEETPIFERELQTMQPVAAKSEFPKNSIQDKLKILRSRRN